MQRHYETSEALCEAVAATSDTVILSFSLGKDSIGAWLFLKNYFKNIVPYYLYLVPDLEFVNKSIRYYENYFQTKIILLPHPSLYRMLNNFVFQAPENCNIIEDLRLKQFNYNDIRKWIKEIKGLPDDTFTASGVRRNDSIMRRVSLKTHGSLNLKARTFFPIFDWDNKRLYDTIKAAKIKLPIDYVMFGRTFDGIDYRFLKPIADRFPDDYRRILEYFPLADLEIKRMEWRQRHHG